MTHTPSHRAAARPHLPRTVPALSRPSLFGD